MQVVISSEGEDEDMGEGDDEDDEGEDDEGEGEDDEGEDDEGEDDEGEDDDDDEARPMPRKDSTRNAMPSASGKVAKSEPKMQQQQVAKSEPKKQEVVKSETKVVRPAHPQFVGGECAMLQDHSREAKTKIKMLDGLLSDHSKVSEWGELLHEVYDDYCVSVRKVGDVQPAIKALLAKVEAGGVISDGSVSDKVAELNGRLKKLQEKLAANQRELAELTTKLENTVSEGEYDTDYADLVKSAEQAEERRDGTLEWIKKVDKDIEAADSSKIKPDDVEALRTALDGLHSYYETVVDVILAQDENREVMRATLAKLTTKSAP